MEKEYEFYNETKNWNFDNFDIKTESLTKWDMYEELRKVTNNTSKVLDLGTGGGEKVIENFPDCEILATDFSKEMINTANESLKMSGRENITFRVMDNLNMDVEDSSFDVVVARNTPTDPRQIYNVLKTGGCLIIRGVDKYDCYDLLIEFNDKKLKDKEKPISIIDYENVLAAGFKEVELIPLYERDYFNSKDTLYNFLLKVPILTNELDKKKLNKYILKNTYSKGIRLSRRYYGIIAKK